MCFSKKSTKLFNWDTSGGTSLQTKAVKVKADTSDFSPTLRRYMMWTAAQIARLDIEKAILQKYFKNVVWISPQVNTKVEVDMATNNDKPYRLRIYIPDDFPNSCPTMVVVSPVQLTQRNGQPIPVGESSFHTQGKIDGFNCICHFFPPRWSQANTLYQVFMKGRLWIEAYEAHLETGKNIDVYLRDQLADADPSTMLHELFRRIFE